MSAQIETSVEGQLGVIALNRPEAINALNLQMIEAISGVLKLWEADDKVRAVLFEGRGPRGFCSGGDVRSARDAVLRGDKAAADGFFAVEYAMNRQIATYPKPVIVIADGIVMGGGPCRLNPSPEAVEPVIGHDPEYPRDALTAS